MTIRSLLPLCLALCAFSLPAAEAPVTTTPNTLNLEFKWTKDKKLLQEFSMKMAQEIPFGGQTMKQDMEMKSDYLLRVLEATAEKTVVEMEFQDQSVDVSMNGNQVISINTGGEDLGGAVPGLDYLREMKGAKLKATYDSKNEIQKLEGLEELKKKIMAKADPATAPMLEQQLSEGYFKQMMRLNDGISNRQLKIGESFDQSVEVDTGAIGKLKQDQTYTFKGWQKKEGRNLALLESTGKMTQVGEGGPSFGGATVKINKANTKGKVWFDPTLGMITDSEVIVDMEMGITIPGQPDAITSKAKQTITTKLREKK